MLHYLFTMLLGCETKRMSGSPSVDFVLCCWKGASCVTTVLISVCEIKKKIKCYIGDYFPLIVLL